MFFQPKKERDVVDNKNQSETDTTSSPKELRVRPKRKSPGRKCAVFPGVRRVVWKSMLDKDQQDEQDKDQDDKDKQDKDQDKQDKDQPEGVTWE